MRSQQQRETNTMIVAKKDIERAKSSAVGKILRGKEADGTRHDHSIELKELLDVKKV